MANAFDDLLGGLVNRLKGVGIGSRTAAQNRAEIDYMTPSNRAAQAGQATRGGPAEYYDLARRTDYNYKAPEYSQTMPLNRGMLSGSGLGLAAPADTYSTAPQSSVDRPSLGRGMYGMGTTPPEGPVDASVINPVFSGSDMDAIIAAGGRPTDSSSVFTTTDAETGKEVIVDAYGNAFFVPPASKTRPGFENETGNLNIPGMFDYAFGSDGRGAILDDASALTTGTSYARDVEGNPFTYIADGIGGMFSAMDAKANPGVTDQAVRRETATTERNLEEEKIKIAQQLQEEKGYTRTQMASPFVQRQIEERLNKTVQEREIEQTDSDNLGIKQEVLDLADLDFGKTQKQKPKEEQGVFDKLMNLLVSPVYGSDTVKNAPTQYDDFGNVVNASTARFISPAAAQSDQLLTRQLGRLGVDSEQSRSRLADLSSKVAMIESGGDMGIKNSNSSATGLYQFLVDDSRGQSALQTAVKRTKKYVNADWLDEVAKTGKVGELSAEKQTILFLGDIMEKEGSDKYLKKLLDPNSSKQEVNDAMMDIYLKLHHTNPDEATLKRAREFIK
tara:strand:- start:192 stop:1868 length:1677 start_codon:yes stop_codon:yes gene_type:complete